MDVEALRHTVATVAYRGGKAVRGATAGFGSFVVAETTRTPVEILAHIGDLFDWAFALADGRQEWHDSEPLEWDREVERFYRAVEAFDARLASGKSLVFPAAKLFQGPVADALTHIGQIAMLRRLAGCPIKGENYFKAEIVTGRAGAQQASARVEFE